MSESRSKLEQILELLLAEENEKAEELLHEYVVSKARSEYEKVFVRQQVSILLRISCCKILVHSGNYTKRNLCSFR